MSNANSLLIRLGDRDSEFIKAWPAAEIYDSAKYGICRSITEAVEESRPSQSSESSK